MRCGLVIGLLGVCVGGCFRASAPPAAQTLSGAVVPLLASPGLRLSMSGAVDGVPAEVQLDLAAPMSSVSQGCIDEPRLLARVRLTRPLGSASGEEYPVTSVVGLTVGSVRLRAFDAAWVPGKSCIVVLGTDLLESTPLVVRPSRREIAFLGAGAELRGGASDGETETIQVPLTRDPVHNWPLLPVRVLQGEASLTATFLFSSALTPSFVFESIARGAGLRSGMDALAGTPPFDAERLPAELTGLLGVSYDRLEVAPGVGVGEGSLALEAGGPPRGIAGLLGPDVWGRFEATIDLRASTLILRRPAVVTSTGRVECARGGSRSEEACYELSQSSSSNGLGVTVSVWRPLPEGGQLSFDFDGPRGPCRVGISFPPGDRGRTAAHTLPWERLRTVMPECAAHLLTVTSVRPGFLEEETLADCPGICAFARELATGRVTCECQPSAVGFGTDALSRFLKRYHMVLKRSPTPPAPEPADP